MDINSAMFADVIGRPSTTMSIIPMECQYKEDKMRKKKWYSLVAEKIDVASGILC